MDFFKGYRGYDHRKEGKIGVLLANLGTPDGPDVPSVRRYLREFLSDPRLIELPRLQWWLILNLFVLPFRPKASAKLYQQVWTEQGSPLLLNAIKQREELASVLEASDPGAFEVEIGMRIGNPSIPSALEALREKHCTRLLILPLYPQYSGTTTASIFDAVADELKRWRWIPELRMTSSYHDHPLYIDALASSIRESWQEHGRPEKLLFSYHGIPKRYFEGGDPYFCFCQKTSRLVGERLGLEKGESITAFQSLFGKEEWIRPYTNETLESLARSGVRSIDVICPGFSVDCLETLEEIEEQNKQVFLDAGGERYHYVHALNARPDHIALLAELVRSNSEGWRGRRIEEPGAEFYKNEVEKTYRARSA